MQRISGIDEVMRVLRPHWHELIKHFEIENGRFKRLLRTDHTSLGRIIKCHLISEIYVNRYLREKLVLSNLEDARLSYSQKVMLLPDRESAPAIVKPGLVRLNRIRNKYAHDLHYDVSVDDIRPMVNVLEVSGRKVHNLECVEVIESFTTLACTWLLVPPPDLEELFTRAFRSVSVIEDGEEE